MILLSAILAGGGGDGLPVVLIGDQSPTGSRTSNGPCSAGIKLTRGGQFHTGFSNSSTTPTFSDVGGNQWSDNEFAAVGDDFECRFDVSSGTLQTGTANTWLAMTSDREWTVSVGGFGASVVLGTLRIRVVGAGSDSDTAAITMTASATP